MLAAEKADLNTCPICGDCARPHDVVDFNKSCEEARGAFLPLSGEPVYYDRCRGCGFCFAPAMCRWPIATFSEKVYNDGYAAIDPDYLERRPRSNAEALATMFPDFVPQGRHLDYGGGNGTLSRSLRQHGWNSVSYDPFADPGVDPAELGSFDLISAFEVFEHVPDIGAVLETLSAALRERGIIFFTTLLSDGAIKPNERLVWWYAAPRNGHISLFTRQSLSLLAERFGFVFASMSPGTHLFLRGAAPDWAASLLRS